VLLEALFVAEPTIDRELRARFLPPAPIHVVVDTAGKEVSLDATAIEALLPADRAVLDLPQVQGLLPQLLERTREIAEERAPAIAARALRQMRRELEPAVAGLQALVATNPAVGGAELEVARTELDRLGAGLHTPRVRLDGLRLILVTDQETDSDD
jgi:hypothetical protein